MFAVVTGGSGSGKSAFAEQLVLELGEGQRIYLATMMCFDEESRKRVKRHREMRKDKGFVTVERYTNLSGIELPKQGILLLECMSNLVANEMYDPEGAGEDCVRQILDGIGKIRKQVRHLVVVTNEIFSDGLLYEEETRRYQRNLGQINREIAKMADEVVEVVYGIPLYHKRKAEGK